MDNNLILCLKCNNEYFEDYEDDSKFLLLTKDKKQAKSLRIHGAKYWRKKLKEELGMVFEIIVKGER